MHQPSRFVSNGAALAVAATVLLVGASAAAQEVRGVVRQSDGVTPASGVVAIFLHEARNDSIVARAVTNDRGRFTAKLPANQITRLRLLRVGFESFNGGIFDLVNGEVREASITLDARRIVLATVDVKAATRCQIKPDGAQLVAQLYNQARTALISSTTRADADLTTRIVNFGRMQDQSGRLLSPISRETLVGRSLRPYASVNATALKKDGYVVADGGDFNYYAPDADVLISDDFLSGHCLQLVQGKDSLAGSIGIAFKPVGSRAQIVDVEGTLWLDRKTSDLQFLQYTYTQLPRHLRQSELGGRVEYAQLPNGVWFVSNWSIRMPIVGVERNVGAARMTALERAVVTGQHVTGGAVEDIRMNNQVLFMNTAAMSAGASPRDSVQGDGSALVMRPGLGNTYDGRSLLKDSLAVEYLCTGQSVADLGGQLSGKVFDETKTVFDGATVRANWTETFTQLGFDRYAFNRRTVSSRSVGGGTYALCGLPLNRDVRVSATRAEEKGKESLVRLSQTVRTATLDLTLDPPSRSPRN